MTNGIPFDPRPWCLDSAAQVCKVCLLSLENGHGARPNNKTNANKPRSARKNLRVPDGPQAPNRVT